MDLTHSQQESINCLESLRKYASQTRARKSSAEQLQLLAAQRQRQQESTYLAYGESSTFSYNPNIDYALQTTIEIEEINKT